jgi:hypothetical protein
LTARTRFELGAIWEARKSDVSERVPTNNVDPRLAHYKRQLALALAERRARGAAFDAALGESRR